MQLDMGIGRLGNRDLSLKLQVVYIFASELGRANIGLYFFVGVPHPFASPKRQYALCFVYYYNSNSELPL